MSDPFDELRRLEQLGLDVNPLSASEVRHRGDRMRRRNNVVAAIGGIAAVALIAVPLSLAARGDDRSDPGPIDTPTPSPSVVQADWLQEIPAGFDLTALPGGATFAYTPRDRSVVDDLTLCGVPTYSSRSDDPAGPALATIGAVYGEAGTESSSGRTLALYPDAEAAQAALDAVASGVDACPRDTSGPGAPLVRAAVPSQLSADDSLTFTEQSEMGGGLLADLTVFQVARVGNALYLSALHTSAGGPQVVGSEVPRAARFSAPVLSDLCVFAEDPCSAPATGPTAIPADFPILEGYPEDSQAESAADGRSGPDRDQPSIRLEACGQQSPVPDAVEMLHGGWTNPEDFRTRQLTTFATPEDAAAWVAALTGLWAGCPEEQTGDGYTTVRSTREGEQYAALVTQYRHQGGFTPGLVIATLVQRGNGVLLSQTYNEGGAGQHPDQEVNFQIDEGLSAVQGLVDRMCTFTDDGC